MDGDVAGIGRWILCHLIKQSLPVVGADGPRVRRAWRAGHDRLRIITQVGDHRDGVCVNIKSVARLLTLPNFLAEVIPKEAHTEGLELGIDARVLLHVRRARHRNWRHGARAPDQDCGQYGHSDDCSHNRNIVAVTSHRNGRETRTASGLLPGPRHPLAELSVAVPPLGSLDLMMIQAHRETQGAGPSGSKFRGWPWVLRTNNLSA